MGDWKHDTEKNIKIITNLIHGEDVCENGMLKSLRDAKEPTQDDFIEMLINDELNTANKKFPLFHSNHEAYAVLLEEVEEAEEEIEDIKIKLSHTWIHIKKNEEEEALDVVMNIRKVAVRAIEELIQVAAMCDKWEMSLGGNEDGSK